MASDFDAFVSYGHADDGGVARQLQAGVERFAKPWYRARALRLFLDSSNLSANPGLWSSIEAALASSSWFVLVASPDAAGSQWVNREIRWWLENRSADRLLVVVASGTLRWDGEAGDFDPDNSTALPPALLGALAEEPRWVTVPGGSEGGAPDELELREAVIDVATAIRDVSKEELVGAAAREHRRTKRWARGAIAGLSALLIAAVVAGLVALGQRDAAVEQARLALARQIASVSQTVAATDLDVSMLLAVQAYRRDANPETRAALFGASTNSPHLVRFLDAGTKVEQLVSSRDGAAVAAGLADGRVLLWPTGRGQPEELFQLSRRIASLGIDDNGDVVVAADKAKAMIWRRNRPVEELSVPLGLHADVAAVSPSGQTVAFHGAPPVFEAADSLTVASASDPSGGIIHRNVWRGLGTSRSIVMPSDRELLSFDPAYGSWEWRRLSDWSLQGASSAGFGTRQYGAATSVDGRFFTVTNGSSQVPVWPTAGHTQATESDIEVEVPLADQNVLALSPEGTRLAVAGGTGTIYVAPVPGDEGEGEDEPVEPLDPIDRPFELTGENAGVLSFAGDDTHLLSASGSVIAEWDLEQLDRLARASKVPLNSACTACGSPRVTISPDGERVAVVDGDGRKGFVQSLGDGGNRQTLPEAELFEYTYGSPLWAADGNFAAFTVWQGGSDGTVPTGMPEGVRAWRGGSGEDAYLAETTTADGEAALILSQEGNVYRQELATGKQREYSPVPPELSLGEVTLQTAAISASPELVATAVEGEVTIEELPDREVVGRIETSDRAQVAFVGDRLLIQREEGPLEIWDLHGTALQRVLPGDENYTWQPVANPDGTVVARRRSDGTIVLDDLVTGARLATFATRATSTFNRTGIAFSPDGSSIVGVSELPNDLSNNYKKGELVIRDISDEALVEAACEAAGRDLTAAEWRTFVGGVDPPGDLSCR